MDLKSNTPPDARSGEPCQLPCMGVEHADGQRLPDAPGDHVRR